MKTLLNVRVDQELKDEIDRLAKEDGISSSECARNILYDYLNYNEESKSLRLFEGPYERVVLYVEPDIKKELPQLVLWLIVNLYSNSYYTEQNLKFAKGALERLTKNIKLSSELRFEFLKVLSDINRVFTEGIHNTQLLFNVPNNTYTINFNLLFSEVYNLINRGYRDE